MARPLTSESADELRKDVQEVWAWSGCYFYPLHQTTRVDVVAFDGDKLEAMLPEDAFRRLLKEYGISNVLWCRELDASEELSIDELPFFHGHSESFIVESSNSWIVYWSHEQTVTFGGIKLIELLKSVLPEWYKAECKWA